MKTVKKVAATILAVLLALVSCGDPTSGGPGTYSGYRVIFNAGEGQGVPPFPQTVAPGNIIELPTQEAMTHPTGKVLAGWNDGERTYNPYYRYVVNKDVEFIAQWKVSTGTVDPGHTHVWGPWVVTTAPTATQSGVETRTCTLDSSHKETRTVPATGGGGNFDVSGTYTRQNVSGYSVTFYNVANLNYGNCLFSWRGQVYQNATYSVSGSALTIKANEAMSLLFTILSAASIRDPEGELWVK